MKRFSKTVDCWFACFLLGVQCVLQYLVILGIACLANSVRHYLPFVFRIGRCQNRVDREKFFLEIKKSQFLNPVYCCLNLKI